MIVRFNKKERKLLRKIIRIQLQSLVAIRNEDTLEDITMHCIDNDITKVQLMNRVDENIEEYKRVLIKPSQIFKILQDADIAILRHILHTEFYIPKYGETPRSIWHKFLTKERLDIYYNPN